MVDETGLSPDDYASMVRAGEVLYARGWRQTFTVRTMVNQWAWLVAEVERGYDDMVEEYASDLSCRDWLAQAWPMLTQPVRTVWHAKIQPLDERFRAATVDDGGKAISGYMGVPPDVWTQVVMRRSAPYRAAARSRSG
ncbi:hypothetical protein AB0C14_38130 [Microbispora hainanensis]|uniref:hypothetical protein n=1 Tax=Microbispora hainanensis TaxID=568844 RepID=UPI0033CC8D5E